MLQIKIIQSDQEATKLESPKGANHHSLIISTKPKKTLSNKLMRLNGKWKATDKDGNCFESDDFIAAYLFCRDCGSDNNSQSVYEKLRRKNYVI